MLGAHVRARVVAVRGDVVDCAGGGAARPGVPRLASERVAGASPVAAVRGRDAALVFRAGGVCVAVGLGGDLVGVDYVVPLGGAAVVARDAAAGARGPRGGGATLLVGAAVVCGASSGRGAVAVRVVRASVAGARGARASRDAAAGRGLVHGRDDMAEFDGGRAAAARGAAAAAAAGRRGSLAGARGAGGAVGAVVGGGVVSVGVVGGSGRGARAQLAVGRGADAGIVSLRARSVGHVAVSHGVAHGAAVARLAGVVVLRTDCAAAGRAHAIVLLARDGSRAGQRAFDGEGAVGGACGLRGVRASVRRGRGGCAGVAPRPVPGSYAAGGSVVAAGRAARHDSPVFVGYTLLLNSSVSSHMKDDCGTGRHGGAHVNDGWRRIMGCAAQGSGEFYISRGVLAGAGWERAEHHGTVRRHGFGVYNVIKNIIHCTGYAHPAA